MEFEIEEKNLIYNKNKKYDCVIIPVINGEELTYQQFFENNLIKNTPCVIKNATNNWIASRDWLKTGVSNTDYLEKKYGETKVIIYNCSSRYFNSQKCEDSTLLKYLEYWKNKENIKTLYYLKDWHLQLQCVNDTFYEVPIYFAADWLNEYFTQCLDDDYRFVYMGPRGSWTPLHSDVFTSYSWSANICGQKKWIFFPPGEEKYLKDNLNNLPYDINEVSHSRKCFEVIQNSGEAIFVPSGWYHQVWNLDDTISINHNWINGCNIFTMWESIKENLNAVEKEIEDCKNMNSFEEHCQTMLNALFGMDYKKFYEFLAFIGDSRINMLTNKSKRTLFHNHRIGTNHIYFDLMRIQEVLEDYLNSDYVKKMEYYLDAKRLLSKIMHSCDNRFIKKL